HITSLFRGVWSLGSILRLTHALPGRCGRMHSRYIPTKFRKGTSTISPTQGERPAFAARRTLIPTATQRKGSVQKKNAQANQSGAGALKNSCRMVRSGFKKSSGVNTRPATDHSNPASTAYLKAINPKPLAAYA